jgi:CRP/FNR family nitrogen fixation transcriptional regulator
MQLQARTTADTLSPRLAAGLLARAEAPAAPRLSTPPAKATALDVLEQFGVRRTVRRGHEFYAAGDPTQFCYRIVSGCVRTVGLDEDGRRQVAEFLLAGDLLGFDSLDAHHLSAEALTDTVVICYPRRAVDSLAEQHGALARRLRDLTMQSLRRAHEKMFLLGRKSAGERVAAFLLEMARRAPGGAAQQGQVELPMSRADIADHLGLTIETVSRTMAQLCRDGAIASVRSGIEIRDRGALEAFGVAGTRH